jgi:S-adenosyl methyltransferase
MIEQGVTQFIELGTGIPTVGNVHEIAWGVTYESRVVYVECDAVAISHLDLLVGKDTPGVAIVQAKINDPDVVLASVRTSELIDFTKPIGLLLPSAAHVLRDPGSVIDSYRQTMPIGSYFALAHVTADGCPELHEAAVLLAKYVTFYLRPVSQIRDLFSDMCMVEPGLVAAGAWRPELDAERESVSAVYAGVGRMN